MVATRARVLLLVLVAGVWLPQAADARETTKCVSGDSADYYDCKFNVKSDTTARADFGTCGNPRFWTITAASAFNNRPTRSGKLLRFRFKSDDDTRSFRVNVRLGKHRAVVTNYSDEAVNVSWTLQC